MPIKNLKFVGQLQEIDQEERWRKAIDRHRRFIADRMNRKFDFEEKLVAYNCLSVKMINKIKSTKTVRKRNEMIIEILGRRQQLEKLIEALAQSNQKHLVKYLECDGSKFFFLSNSEYFVWLITINNPIQ